MSSRTQRVVECHIARNNAVSSTGDGFAVTIESQDVNTSKEVLRRAKR
jgi:hypothetical protein